MPRPSKDAWCLSMAALVAQRSTCLRRAVGCVLVNARGHVLATGYNGVATGRPHCNEPTGFNFIYANGVDASRPISGQATGEVAVLGHACPGAQASSGIALDACQAVHAEQCALLQCHDVYQIATCYVTTSPCVTCTKLLMNTSCRRIVFNERYTHDEAARALWEDLATQRTWECL